MVNLLYALSAVYIIAWAIGFFIMHTGVIMLLALLPAILLLLLRIIQKKPVTEKQTELYKHQTEAHWF